MLNNLWYNIKQIWGDNMYKTIEKLYKEKSPYNRIKKMDILDIDCIHFNFISF